MSSISMFSLNYLPFEKLYDQYQSDDISKTKLLTSLFFNYSELIWSSSFTHEVNLVFLEGGKKKIQDTTNSELIHKVLQLGNWMILGALLRIRTTVAIPILALTLGAKYCNFYRINQAADSIDEENELEELDPTLETNSPTLLPIVNMLKEVGGESLCFAFSEQVLKHEELKSLWSSEEQEEKQQVIRDIEEACTHGLSVSSAYSAVGNEKFIFQLKILLNSILKMNSKEKQKDYIKRVEEAFALKDIERTEAINKILQDNVPSEETLEGYILSQVMEFHNEFLDSVDKKLLNYKQQGWSDLAFSYAESIPKEFNWQFPRCIERMMTCMNSGDEKITALLKIFNQQNEELGNFGFYNEELKAMNWYQSMSEPTESQVKAECPYITKGEIAFLLHKFGWVVQP